MTNTLRWGVCLVLAVALAAAGHGCGSNNDKRDRERCEQCDPAQINSDCVDQCVRFCVADDPDCTARCNSECDRCKAELACRQCTSDCTGTVARCAPVDEPLVCEDGTF
ncbi:MAG TPA: hypothetical protein VGK30_19475 [Candidatus Binatia bacterium]|jgi:hypothetical protein